MYKSQNFSPVNLISKNWNLRNLYTSLNCENGKSFQLPTLNKISKKVGKVGKELAIFDKKCNSAEEWLFKVKIP